PHLSVEILQMPDKTRSIKKEARIAAGNELRFDSVQFLAIAPKFDSTLHITVSRHAYQFLKSSSSDETGTNSRRKAPPLQSENRYIHPQRIGSGGMCPVGERIEEKVR